MGLDTIELILQLEEEFVIDMPDRDTQALMTIDDLAKYLVSRTKGLRSETSHEYATSRITTILIRDFGVDRTKIRASSKIVNDLGLE